jgi:methyl-accepting chemotaxis protein
VAIKDNRWAIVVEMAESEVFAEVDTILRRALMYAAMVLVVAVVLSYGLGILVSRMIISPLKTLVASFQNIAEGDGDLSVHLASAERRDEIGELSVSFNSFVKNIHDVVQKVVATALSLNTVSKKLADFSTENSESVNHQRDITHSIVHAINEFSVSNAEIVERSAQAQQAMARVSVATENGRKTPSVANRKW